MAGVKRVKTDVEYATQQQREMGGIIRSYVFHPGPDDTWRIIHVTKDAFPLEWIGKTEIRPWRLPKAPEEGIVNLSEVAIIAVEDEGKVPWPTGWTEPVMLIERSSRGRVVVSEARKPYTA